MTDERRMFSVTQVNEYIKMLIDGAPALSHIMIRGEISNFKNHYATGHFYFTLKDESSAMKAVMFRSSAQRLGFVPQDGMKVIVAGRVSVFPRDGVYQIYAEDIQPDGVGALYFAFEQLKNKLESEGLFDPARKRAIVRFPKKIGIVTSPTGAAIRDMINIITRRYPAVQLYIYPAQVQGPSAPATLCAGIEFFNTALPVDTIIIGRGGGSLEDLWAFNNEKLARYVAASNIPVISAVGHEVDFTICDFAADLRAPTPSAAAELAVPDRAELSQRVSALSSRLGSALERGVAEKRRRLDALAASRILSDPMRFVDDKKMTVASLGERLDGAAGRVCETGQRELSARAAQLGALNPFAVLTRGYSAMFIDGCAVKSVKQLSAGERVKLRLSDGEAEADITNTKEFGNL
ncbi:MAG: exodeoxyribonuclease VII large subunit [Clostridia bacterium]|nr:exodeoxyribonuclease VII large subunit [Clostridia bacterium]